MSLERVCGCFLADVSGGRHPPYPPLFVPSLRYPSLFVPSLRYPPLFVPSLHYPPLFVPSLRYPSLFVPSLRYPSLFVPSLRYPSLFVPSLRYPSLFVPSLRYPPLFVPSLRYPSLFVPSLRYPSLFVPSLHYPPLFVPSLRYRLSICWLHQKGMCARFILSALNKTCFEPTLFSQHSFPLILLLAFVFGSISNTLLRVSFRLKWFINLTIHPSLTFFPSPHLKWQ